MALEDVLVGGAGAINFAAVVVVVQDGVEVGIGEDADSAVSSADVDALARPAEKILVGLDRLLMAGDGIGVGGGENKNIIRLNVGSGSDMLAIALKAYGTGSLSTRLWTHLVADDQRLALRVPSQCECITQTFDLVDAILGAHIPELDDTIVAHAAELGVLDRVEGDLLDGGSMALQLGGEAHIGPLWIPCCPPRQPVNPRM